MRAELDPNWATLPLEIVQRDGRTVLLLEYPGGGSGGATLLSRSIGSPWDLRSMLRVGCGIAAALDQLHARGLVHKDVRPSNLFVNVVEGHAWLTGFGFVSRLRRERVPPSPPEVISGTLAYMSPEQTGRMNRSIDSRTDLYSFGVTLHEMATASLPFSATTPMEWIHCHIARMPASLVDVVPEQVAAIIGKLLAKNAEDRYQTAAGAQADLQRCLVEFEARGCIDPFPLDAHNASDRLFVPEKLYGRDAAIATLTAAFDRVATHGSTEVLLLSGYSGVGKSSLVNELHRVLVSGRGLFATGKFDQYKRGIPYAPLGRALRSLVLPLLGKGEAEVTEWRQALLDALGSNGALLLGLIPELAIIVGEQSPVSQLGPKEAKDRFNAVIRRFVNVFARSGHTLVLFLDDLQWSDEATLQLLQHLVTHPELRNVLFIGAFRDNEVSPADPLTPWLADIRLNTRLQEIVLAPLHRDHVEQLVADAIHCDRGTVGPLAALVHEKTDGNPFFALQFITALADEALLAFDYSARAWRWDLPRIRAKGFTDNVALLMASKLARLSPATQRALGELACLGSSASIERVRLVHDEQCVDVESLLWEAVAAGLVLLRDRAYTFLHDRVHEAAYALMAGPDRVAVHLRIGRALLSRTAPDNLEEIVFEVTNHLNRGMDLITDETERENAAQLNLRAGMRAKGQAAHASALTYFEAGARALGLASWERHHQLTFGLELGRAECEMLSGRAEEAGIRLSDLHERAQDVVAQAAITSVEVDLNITLVRANCAVAVCLQFLERRGVRWAARPSHADVIEEYAQLWRLVDGRPLDSLLHLPMMDDPCAQATMHVLSKLIAPATLVDSNLGVLAALRMANVSLEHGLTDSSAYGFACVAMATGHVFGEHHLALPLAQLSVDLVDKRGLEGFASGVYLVFGLLVLPWHGNLRLAGSFLERTFEVGTRTGDFTHSAYSRAGLVTNLLFCGDPLEDVEGVAMEGLAFARRTRVGIVIAYIADQLQLVRMLRGMKPRFGHFDDAEFNELQREQEFETNPTLSVASFFYWTRKMQARFWADCVEEALVAELKARNALGTHPPRLEHADYHLYAGLSHAAAVAQQPTFHRDLLAKHHQQLQLFARFCPENFAASAALLEAEIARLGSEDIQAEQLYEEAIRVARKGGLLPIEAVSAELAARFHRARGLETIAGAYLSVARTAYHRWGASAKVRQLEESWDGATTRTPVFHDGNLRSADVDLETVVSVSQAVSSEMVLNTLIERILTIALENAGADRGLLGLPRDGELFLEAQALAASGKVEVRLASCAVSESNAPESVFRFVTRTLKVVILDDAVSSSSQFGDDPYFRAGVRSVLCLPLVKQKRLIGILYLENNHLPGVFTGRRIALLELLASQAAISLENAQLLSDLRGAQDQLRTAVLDNRRMIDAIPVAAWRTQPDGAIDGLNQEWLDYTGLTREQGAGFGWVAAFDPDEVAMNHWNRMRAEGLEGEVELRVRRHDGVFRRFVVRIRPYRDESGQIVKWYGTNIDIEDLKQAQDELRRNEALLAQGQRVSATGSFLWKLGSDKMKFSDELYRIFGFEPGTLLTVDRIVQRVHPEDRSLFVAKIDLARSGVVDHDYQIRLQMSDGAVRYIHTSVHVSDERESGMELIGVMQDITARTLAEVALGRVRSELADMTRVASLGALSASITHEVSQPLAGIAINASTSIRMLTGDPPNVEGALEPLRRVLRDSDRASKVVVRLRAMFSNKDDAFDTVDLNQATREVLALSIGDLQRNQIVLRSELSYGLPKVRGDRVQLQQVILNLVLNAIEAMTDVDDRPRHLVVRTGLDNDANAYLNVADVGIGFQPADAEKMFEAFYTTKKSGMGVGLSVSNTIVHRHGGRMWATPNTVGPGATFSFSIPIGCDDAGPIG